MQKYLDQLYEKLEGIILLKRQTTQLHFYRLALANPYLRPPKELNVLGHEGLLSALGGELTASLPQAGVTI